MGKKKGPEIKLIGSHAFWRPGKKYARIFVGTVPVFLVVEMFFVVKFTIMAYFGRIIDGNLTEIRAKRCDHFSGFYNDIHSISFFFYYFS